MIIALSVFIIFILILLLLGQFFYYRKRKVAYSIWILTVIIIILAVIDSNSKPMYVREEEKGIVGKYSIDVTHSIYDSLPIEEKYTNLVLLVNSNNSFYLNLKSPFFADTLGEWNLFDDGDISFIECKFKGGDKTQVLSDSTNWKFQAGGILNSANGDYINFIKH